MAPMTSIRVPLRTAGRPGSAHQPRRDSLSFLLLDPFRAEDERKLLAFLFREVRELVGFHADLVLVELALRTDGDPLPRRHRERAGDETCYPGEEHDPGVPRRPSGYAHD